MARQVFACSYRKTFQRRVAPDEIIAIFDRATISGLSLLNTIRHSRARDPLRDCAGATDDDDHEQQEQTAAQQHDVFTQAGIGE